MQIRAHDCEFSEKQNEVRYLPPIWNEIGLDGTTLPGPLPTLKRVPDLWLSAERECYGVSCLNLYQKTIGDGLGLTDRAGGGEERTAAFWGLEGSYF